MAKVLVPLAQGCEELEAVTLIDLMVRAGIEVVTASLDDERVITASRGVQLIAQTTLDQVLGQEFDLVVLPGGLPGADYLNEDPRIIELLQRTVQHGGLSAAICAAPKVLVSAGLLDNREATSYPGVIDVEPAPGMQYLDLPVVDAGSVLTSKGPGTAMDFALILIERLCGAEKRLEVEQGLQRS
ncbi:DJ-1 family glyoxalase III [Thiomicrorhabdus heinhorstiae]|uniref:DJ-1/PfpI family protein n=1 Tax=Thiomicrorhabdus heinhorstiae TaxID=2748010 RepID=A0ABS0BVM2_9GAMM|nr:DJ-1 family glyoxalase III [Thiomicrorhabdus heinhorstiae]MBF6057844.1 DJ-1/PfpI family protein [Thiomicrorhabdus heinhorstiae]